MIPHRQQLKAANATYQVLGVFGNGRIEEFLTGRVVELDELQLPEVQQKIAARLAEFHKLLSISHTPACTFWDTLASWYPYPFRSPSSICPRPGGSILKAFLYCHFLYHCGVPWVTPCYRTAPDRLEQAENLTLEDPQQQAAVQLMDFKQYQADIK